MMKSKKIEGDFILERNYIKRHIFIYIFPEGTLQSTWQRAVTR